MNQLVAFPRHRAPALVAAAGERAQTRFWEFFVSNIRNPHTRRAYGRSIAEFLAWCEQHGLASIIDVEPLHVGTYIESLTRSHSAPTAKQNLAAIRMLFDWLVTARSSPPIRPTRCAVRSMSSRPARPRCSPENRPASSLTASKPQPWSACVTRALISVMTFAFSRIGAVVAMHVEDYYPKGKRRWVRLHEKGGKRHGIRDGGKTPLFRSAVGRTGTLTATAMNRVDAWRMIQRRASTHARIGCHTFRATGITAYLEAGGTLENAQAMAAHESPRTTKLYDRTGDEITLDEVERITI